MSQRLILIFALLVAIISILSALLHNNTKSSPRVVETQITCEKGYRSQIDNLLEINLLLKKNFATDEFGYLRSSYHGDDKCNRQNRIKIFHSVKKILKIDEKACLRETIDHVSAEHYVCALQTLIAVIDLADTYTDSLIASGKIVEAEHIVLTLSAYVAGFPRGTLAGREGWSRVLYVDLLAKVIKARSVCRTRDQ